MKTSFYFFSNKWFLRTQKTKTNPIPQTSFLCFLFLRIENSYWTQEPNRPLTFLTLFSMKMLYSVKVIKSILQLQTPYKK